MAQPSKFSPATFTNKGFDSNLLASLDMELQDLKSIVNTVINNLGVIQRDDTKLANGSVHKEAIAAEALALFASTWNPRGAWASATSYARLDAVTESGATYLCLSAHTSGTFATDLSNSLWMLIASGGSVAGGGAAAVDLIALSTGGTASNYTATTGNSYGSWANVPPMLVDWDQPCNAGATFSVDGLSAKNLLIDGETVNARDLEHQDFVVYDADLDACLVLGRSRTEEFIPAAAMMNDDTSPATEAAIGKLLTFQLADNQIIWLPVRRMRGVSTINLTVHAAMTAGVSSVNAKLKASVYELSTSNIADVTLDTSAAHEPSVPGGANDPFTFTMELDVSSIADDSWISISLMRETSSSPHSGDVAIFAAEIR